MCFHVPLGLTNVALLSLQRTDKKRTLQFKGGWVVRGQKSCLLVSPLEPPPPSDPRDYLFTATQGITHASPFSPCSLETSCSAVLAGDACLHPAPAPEDARSEMQAGRDAEWNGRQRTAAHPHGPGHTRLYSLRKREVTDRHQGNGTEPLSSGGEISAQKSALAPAGPCTGILPPPTLQDTEMKTCSLQAKLRLTRRRGST